VRLARAEAFRVKLPLVHEFETSSHRKAELEHILVRLEDADGTVGWGEVASPSAPLYGPDTTDTSWLILERYLLAAATAPDAEGLLEQPAEAWRVWARIKGHQFAKAGVEMAVWDLAARRRGVSVAGLLGGEQARIPAGVSLGIEPSVEALLEQVARHVEDGYLRVKLKIAPGWDVGPVNAARERFPDLALQVDANGAYAPGSRQAAALEELDDAGLLLIEQPFPASELLATAALQERMTTPICLDESVVDLGQLATAVALDAGRILNVKVSRMGGLGPARAAVGAATAAGWQAWVGGMHEFGVGRSANVAFASLPGCTLPSDVSGSDKYYASDLVDPPIRATAGYVEVPHDRPGLGHTVDEARVRAEAVATLQHKP
jgi:o-succinylbenzoate synthase